MGRLVILGGPSCAGKGPLVAALARFHPELSTRLSKLVLYNTRSPRPGEKDGVDYHFRSREAIDRLAAQNGFPTFEVRGDFQALDLEDLRARLVSSDVLFEGNPYVGEALIKLSDSEKISRLAVFLSPFSREELTDLGERLGNGLPALVSEVMRRKQARRKERQRGILTRPDFDEIERRATAAYTEIKMAHLFERVIVCHDGEDSENWDGFYYPLADARRALTAFVSLLKGKKEGDAIEDWEGLEFP